MFKNIATTALMLVYVCSITACSTTYYYKGDGVVLSQKKVSDRDYKPHDGTKTGAVVGGSVGAVSGAAAGGVLGLAITSWLATDTLSIIGGTLAGGVIGAVAVGAAGGALGGGLGYVVDVGRPNMGTYQYVVKLNNQSNPLTITQYSSPIPVNAKVRVIEKDNATYIKQD